MATLISNAATTQLLSGAATFAAAETGALALNLIRNTTATLSAASTVTSATFTVTNTKVIDGALLWLKAGATGATGTFKVDLQKGGVSQASVTVNKADLPSDGSIAIGAMVPVFFKFTGTATGDGGANWTLVLTTTGTVTVIYALNAAGSTNLTRALRTTTAATLAAGDDFYIIGDLTGAGTHTSRTVTMDSTAATVYGNGAVNSTTVSGGLCAVGAYGTLTYGNSASTNYVLRLAGDLYVGGFGTLNVGASGAEIPRNSTAVLEFQQVSATGDFGLRNLDATVNTAGLSRTSGKNIVQCKLTADVTSASVIVSNTNTNCTATAQNGIGPDGASLSGITLVDTVTNATHSTAGSGASITNTTQTATVWLARGSGTNNRFCRVTVGNNTVQSAVTNGFFSDIDLQAGTAGAVTAVGTGTATSVSITAVNGGYLIRMTGKVASGVATPSLLINICSAAGTLSFAGANNIALIMDNAAIVTAASISDTTINVDTDTGWLANDVIAVAHTDKTQENCELFLLNANAGASSMVSSEYPLNTGNSSFSGTHSGTTAPLIAEVGLLTRNVKIRSTSSTLGTYVYCTALSVFNASWTEFYNMGVAITNKRGIEIDSTVSGTAGAKSITFCSIHDFMSNGLFVGAGASANLTFSNNIGYLSKSTTFVTINGAITAADYTFDSNLFMRSSSVCFLLADVSGTITNNISPGAGSNAFSFSSGSNPTMGNLDGNIAHGSGSNGFSFSTHGLAGTISNLVSYRNASCGISSTASSPDLWFNNPIVFGNNASASVGNVLAADSLNIIGGAISGDTSNATTAGVVLGSNETVTVNLIGVDFSATASAIYAVNTTEDINTNATLQLIIGRIINCKFGAPLLVPTSKPSWAKRSFFAIEKYNQTAGDHRTIMPFGTVQTDNVIFNAAAPSMRMTPTSSSFKLESATNVVLGNGFLSSVASGGTVTVSVNIRKSVIGDGAAYNGNQPRLIQRANAALGQTADVVLATYASAAGSWNTLSATSSVATGDDGAWEFIVDCDGTTGWINVDDWSAT